MATSAPPNAGPTERATLIPTLLRVMAGRRSFGPTISGINVCQAGPARASKTSIPNRMSNNETGEMSPSSVSTPSSADKTIIATWVTSSSLRLFNMSPSAPAGRARTKKGALAATWMSDTRSGEGESDVINHAAPTSLM